MSQQRSLEQKRAKVAWDAISSYKNAHDTDKQSKMRALALGAPAEIQMIGLGQALAFWRAKGRKEKENERHHQDFYDSVSGWVKGQIKWSTSDSLLEWIINTASTSDYRRATSETLAFLKWMKYFAEGELEKGKP